MYCTKCGKPILDEQGKFCAYCGNLIASVIYQADGQSEGIKINTKIKTKSIIWATSLFYLDAAIWTILCIIQWFSILSNPLLVIWNTAVTVFCYFLASAIYKQRVWGYSWGVGTSLLNAILSFIYAIVNFGGGNVLYFLIFAFLFIIDLSVFIILKANAQCFGIDKKNKHKWNIRFDQNDIDDEQNEEDSAGDS